MNRRSWIFVSLIALAIVLVFLIRSPINSSTTPVSTEANPVVNKTLNKETKSPDSPLDSSTLNTSTLTVSSTQQPLGDQDIALADCYNHLKNEVLSNKAYSTKFYEQIAESLNEIAPEWLFQQNRPFSHPLPASSASVKFYSALAYAHLLRGAYQVVPKDLKKALLLLSEVHQQDLENSAPLAFTALIFKELDSDADVRRTLLQIKNTTKRFDSYQLKVTRQILGTVKTSADYLLATEITSKIPLPDNKGLLKLITEYKATFLAQQLIAPTLAEDHVYMGVEYNLLDYSIGCAALNKLQPEKKCPSAIELAQIKTNSVNLTELYPANLNKNCSLNELDSTVAVIQKILSKY